MSYTDKRTVQIPMTLFIDLLDFVSDPVEYEFLRDDISRALGEKYDALVRRELFTKYKTAEVGTQDRERFRREYLDAAGITRSFRSSEEVPC